MIRLGLQHHDGPLISLGVGCWMRMGPTVKFRCPFCEGMYDVPSSEVDDRGAVTTASDGGPFYCATTGCDFVRWLRFEGWRPDVTS